MANVKTNRTVNLCIKVSPDIKAEIARKKRLGFNLSSEFEKWYMTSYMVKQLLEDKKKILEDNLKIVDEGLSRISKQEEIEQYLSLSPNELTKFRSAIQRFKLPDSQFGAFISICDTRKKITKKDFLKLKQKYN